MRDAKNFFCKLIFFVIVVLFSQNVFNRNPFLQLREGVRIEIGYFLELFLNLRPPQVPKDFFSPFSGLQRWGSLQLNTILHKGEEESLAKWFQYCIGMFQQVIIVYRKSGGYYTRKNIFAGFTKNPCNQKFFFFFLGGGGDMS